ncbi:Quinone oxidoreductase [hydrothermal vent metagenome]|uniref:Quinone oxidoreductase n=1 Tax=hydrothermal vent metagenome TaxID=652676 RepID=A0A3B0TE01_9ZZZZ
MPYAIFAPRAGGPDTLEKRDIDLPVPGKGQVLIRQTAVGVNYIDIYFRQGLYPWPVEEDLILGSEGAGVAEALGSGVTGFAEGARVAYTFPNGAYATHRLVPATHLVELPDGIDDKTAAAIMLKGLTAHYLIHRSYKVAAGDTVLVHAAAGGVGLIVGQWLAALGVTAIGTAGGAKKCALAAANGYAHTIDYRSEDVAARVAEITGGAGVDAVYDSVGKDTYEGSLAALKTFGTFVSFGQSSGPVTDFKLTDLAKKSLTATRPTLFHFIADRDYLENAAAELFAMVKSGKIKVAVNQTLPLDQAAQAHRLLEGRKTTGCTVLVP